MYPTSLCPKNPIKGIVQSLLSTKGFVVPCLGHNITFFFTGSGQQQRKIHPIIIEKLNNGQITDIIDIGGAGALDPELRVGDFVLDQGDISTAQSKPFQLLTRQETKQIFETIAKERGVRFFESKVLTSTKMVISRQKRLHYYHETNCKVVQMEHFWFLEELKKRIDPDAFRRLYVTHLEVVTDAVPKNDSILANTRGLIEAFFNVLIRNQQFLGTVKSAFLKQWLR